MIPTQDEFNQWQPRFCFHCSQQLTYPCASIPGPRGAIHFHAECVWPFAEQLVDHILAIKEQHPAQLRDWNGIYDFLHPPKPPEPEKKSDNTPDLPLPDL